MIPVIAVISVNQEYSASENNKETGQQRAFVDGDLKIRPSMTELLSENFALF